MGAGAKQTIFLADGAAVVRTAVGESPSVHQPRTQHHACILAEETARLRVQEAKLARDAADYALHQAQAAAATVSAKFAQVGAAVRVATQTGGTPPFATSLALAVAAPGVHKLLAHPAVVLWPEA